MREVKPGKTRLLLIAAFVVPCVGFAAEEPPEAPRPVYRFEIGMSLEDVLKVVPGPLWVSGTLYAVDRNELLEKYAMHPPREEMEKRVLTEVTFSDPVINAEFNYYNELLKIEAWKPALARVVVVETARRERAARRQRPESYYLGMTLGELIEMTDGDYDVWPCGGIAWYEEKGEPTRAQRRDYGKASVRVPGRANLLFNHYGQLISIHEHGWPQWALLATVGGVIVALVCLARWLTIRPQGGSCNGPGNGASAK